MSVCLTEGCGFESRRARYEQFKMLHYININLSTYLTIFLSVGLGLIISGVVLTLSYVVSKHAPDSEKTSAYECGFEPFEDARNRFDVRFYIVAILFLIFDLEVVYLFP